ncbi:CDP-alcohol phosphatidyltransferase family protein [Rhodoblastus sp. 17X3]|jgi:cardiolipin synthase (CMP-forming)|uniref:CDP-alcohol phosphatidyltransferase family protein n=1 Tax=Rhodoblastus sp. 17X3 TaxID=3047026 RepID=UPI0024B7BDD1|nr:CDP-alcohol phosphatidyltransferase family protein [Rhodoblastus sp. 17X3]MDI9848108.1 CDP-alcohol phosphatidyltransferase family protein [Rhodoblastus sp. 17X3]
MYRKWFAFLPNLISLGRLILVPVSVDMIASRRWPEALAIFLIAGISDGLDGWIARRFDLRTELGAYLDAIADKALLVCDYVTLAIVGVLPLWLALLVVSRDLMIVGAVILCWLLERPMEIKPHWLSKANTFGQLGFVAAVLAALAFSVPLGSWAVAGQWLVAALTLASLAAYFRRWVTHMSV